ncbi:nucleotidyl transferase [Shewanella sp. UCD-FRSSP16_17]|uniref:nucleotidyltransferase family protein n=1 Tax=Shewanella sp. UCD-FRSSP16_17 TaxID=1853256 RepID=UPI0007EE9AFC|nr:nucleotidyltransferase family protein [Shewanella sp. UCD-FRSSP16_17]OBT09106.1 nucleotidyl transferase [Shewanella sp. UCD-FRSSP16_17]
MKHTIKLNEKTTFNEAIGELDKAGVGFLACVNSDNVLIGILTDGDVRRAILNGESDLKNIINSNPFTMSSQANKQEIIAKLIKLHRRHMPLINTAGELDSVFYLDSVEFENKKNSVVIMAGGLGSRLGKLTEHTPKPMLTVGGKPILKHILEQFREQGFRNFIFCVNYKKEVIKDYFGDGSKLGVDISYVEEKKRLGTAGALSLIEHKLEHPFFIINGDVMTNLDFSSFLESHVSSKSFATMAVREFEHQIAYGVVETDDHSNIVGLTEKPTVKYNINSGVYILSPDTLDFVPQDVFYDMPSLFEDLISLDYNTKAYLIDDYWIDIGIEEQLNKANKDFSVNGESK